MGLIFIFCLHTLGHLLLNWIYNSQNHFVASKPVKNPCYTLNGLVSISWTSSNGNSNRSWSYWTTSTNMPYLGNCTLHNCHMYRPTSTWSRPAQLAQIRQTRQQLQGTPIWPHEDGHKQQQHPFRQTRPAEWWVYISTGLGKTWHCEQDLCRWVPRLKPCGNH